MGQRERVLMSAAVAGLGLLASQGFAATQTWDPLLTHNTGTAGGSGNWDATLNWTTGTTDAAWGSDIARFANTAGTVAVGSGGVSANAIIFAVTGYTLGGTGAITMTGPANISWFGSGVTTESISAVLSGSVGLTIQSGSGGTAHVLNLSGANNYTGTTTIYGATANFQNINTNASGSIVLDAGVLKLDFSQLASSTASNILDSTSSVTLGYGGTFTLASKSAAANSQTLAGLTIGNGSSTLTVVDGSAAATAVLSLGGITRNVGGTANFVQPTVNAAITTANGYTTSALVDAYGLLGAGLTVGTTLNNGTDWATKNANGNIVAYAAYTTQNNPNSWLTNQNVTDAAGGFNGSIAGSGSLTIGSIRFNVAATSAIDLGTSTLSVADGILVTNVSTSGSTISGGTLTGAAGKDLVVINNSAAAAAGLTISSAIADNGSATGLTKAGAGFLTLSGNNTYTGPTMVAAGTLNINSNTAIGTGALTILNGASIDNTSAGDETLSTGVITLGTPGANSSVTYAGAAGRTLNLGANGVVLQFGSSTVNNNNSGNSLALNVNGGTLNIQGNITPAAGFFNSELIKQGLGTLILSGANTFPNDATTATAGKLLFRGGTLVLNNAAALGAGGLNVSAPLVGVTDTLDSTALSPLTLNNPTMAVSTNFTYLGTQSLNYGTGAVAFNAFSPTITVVDKTLTLGGVISGNQITLGLTKAGAGTLALGGVSTFTGGTTVSAGMLSIATTGNINTTSGVSIGAGEFNFNGTTALTKAPTFTGTGGVLSGTGKISTAVNVTSGNSIHPGNGLGTISTGALTIASGGTYQADINFGADTSDQITVTGAVNLGGNLDLVLTNGTLVQGVSQTFTLINADAADPISGDFANITLTADVGTYAFTTAENGGASGHNYTITITAPEPGTLSLLGMGTGLLLARRRRNLVPAVAQ